MPYLINPDRGFIVTANNHIVDDKYMHWLNGGFMIDTRSKAIENAIKNYIISNKKIDEFIVMEKFLNIINDPFCSEMLGSIFNTMEKDEKYRKILNDSTEANYEKSIFIFLLISYILNLSYNNC